MKTKSSASTNLTAFKLSDGVEEFYLENGLQVLIKPVPSSNVVSTWIFYRVGSRNEAPGTTGVSHWCEHMLFKGGGKLGKGDVHNLVSTEGGRNNAFTDHDLTAYYETLPKEKLGLSLFIESERMANTAFDPTEVTSERQVVISEREGSENYPMWQSREELFATAFHVHPYRWPVIGWKSDLRIITRDDLYNHYRKYYHPNNATMVLTGNLDVKETLSKVRDLFSGIRAGPKAPKQIPFPEPEQRGERVSKIVQPGGLDYMDVGFHVPQTIHEDTPALIVLSAILGGWRGLLGFFGDRFVPKSNRLYKALVEGKLASEVNTYFPVNIDPGLLYFELTLLSGRSVSDAKEALFRELDGIKDAPPNEDEMRIAFNQIRSWHAYENDGVSLQALSIGYMEVIQSRTLGDDLVQNSLNVKPEDVQRVAKRYLAETNRSVCTYESTQK